MTCRHAPGDPNCGSSRSYVSPEPVTPDSSNYEIVDVAVVESNLVMKVKYPNCRRCAFEGTKVMVFLNVSAVQALRWKKIDPHFRDAKPHLDTEAPSPAARFPATPGGWTDALSYARGHVSVAARR